MRQLPKAKEIAKNLVQVLPCANSMCGLDETRSNIVVTEAMKEYCRQVLDYVAENAKLNFDEAGRMRVDKESILKIKVQLL